MIQVKPYKPQKIDNMTKASDLEKPKRTLDDYARVAGIQPKRNPLEPYAKLWREQQAGGTVGATPGTATPKPANYVGNAKPQTTAQMAAVSAEGGIPEYTPGSGLSAPKKAVSGSNAGGIRTGGFSNSGNIGSTGLGQSAGASQTQPKADPWKGYREAYEKSMALKTSPATPAANYGPLQPYAKAAGLVPDTDLDMKVSSGLAGQQGGGSVPNNRLARAEDPWVRYAEVAGVPYTPSKPGQLVKPGTGVAEQIKSEQLSETPFAPEDATVETPRYDEYSSWRKSFDDKYGGDFATFDPSGLDDYDRELYDLNKANYDIGMAEEERLRAALRETERQRNLQLQQAFINSELTKKYLPIYLKQAGMGGLGVSQSMLAQLANDYQQSRNDIESGIEQNKRITLDDYAAVMRENAYKNQQDILTKQKEHEGEIKTKQAEAFDRASNLLMSADTTEKIDKLLADYKDLLDEDQYQVLIAQADSLRNDPNFELNEEYLRNYEALGDITRTSIKYNKGFGEGKGDNFSLKDANGNRINIETGLEVKDSAIIQKASNVPEYNVFGLNDKVYIKMNGKIFEVVGRGNAGRNYDKLYEAVFNKPYVE